MTDFSSPPLPERLRDGLDRLASLQRLEQWRVSGAQGLNPTQISILRLLGRPGLAGSRVQTIAAELGLAQPTVTDSLLALERKGYILRQSDRRDGRAVHIELSEAGRTALQNAQARMTLAGKALAALSDEEQTILLRITIKMIRALLEDGAMPVQRMCVTCRYFRPHAQPQTSRPHYCEFVKAPFAADDIRLDCGDHDAASSDHQAATWRRFIATVPGSGQNHHQEKIE